jgi:hypothetical protein
MATYIVKSTYLRQSAARISQGLRAGDSFVLMHYKEPVGYITSDVPKKLLKEAGLKERDEFPELPD